MIKEHEKSLASKYDEAIKVLEDELKQIKNGLAVESEDVEKKLIDKFLK
jgi:hypothetical protein